MATDLKTYFAAQMESPEFRDSYEDAEELDSLIDHLVELRKQKRMTQKDVAKRMGVKQPTVSGFENQDSDPRISTLQRFARAVGARVCLEVELPDQSGEWTKALRGGRWTRDCDSLLRAKPSHYQPTLGGPIVVTGGIALGSSYVAANSKRTDFALAVG